MIVLLSWWWFGERTNQRQWLGLSLCFLGLDWYCSRSWEVLQKFELVPDLVASSSAGLCFLHHTARIKPAISLMSFLAVTFALGEAADSLMLLSGIG